VDERAIALGRGKYSITDAHKSGGREGGATSVLFPFLSSKEFLERFDGLPTVGGCSLNFGVLIGRLSHLRAITSLKWVVIGRPREERGEESLEVAEVHSDDGNRRRGLSLSLERDSLSREREGGR
jgi:hypothetical protein